MANIRFSLTQFLTFTTKVSTSAKMNYIAEIKESPDYEYSHDYWKGLRDKIKSVLSADQSLDEIIKYAATVPDRKRDNYLRAANKFRSFLKNKKYEYFEVGRSAWTETPGLVISASPEFGLIIDGQKFFIKNYYKKQRSDEKVVKRNIESTLTLMKIAEANFDTTDGKFAVLNLQNGRLIQSDAPASADLMAFKIDASTLINIWQSV